MIITLIKSEIIDDLIKRSRLEAESIEDPNARYRIEVGTEKTDEIYRELMSVMAALAKLVRRYLITYDSLEADDTLGVKDGYEFIFDVSDRRAEGKAEMLATLMHDYAVNYVLSRYYATVTAQDLSNAHSAITATIADEIVDALYAKKEPMV